jgi:hypothetical protein
VLYNTRVSPDLEFVEVLGFLVPDVHAVDDRAARPFAAEVDEALDRVGVALENRLDGPVPVVSYPAGHAALAGETPRRVPEEHALNPPVDDHAPPDHRPYSRAA